MLVIFRTPHAHAGLHAQTLILERIAEILVLVMKVDFHKALAFMSAEHQAFGRLTYPEIPLSSDESHAELERGIYHSTTVQQQLPHRKTQLTADDTRQYELECDISGTSDVFHRREFSRVGLSKDDTWARFSSGNDGVMVKGHLFKGLDSTHP